MSFVGKVRELYEGAGGKVFLFFDYEKLVFNFLIAGSFWGWMEN